MNPPLLLPILSYPDPRLHKVAKPVQAVDERIHALIERAERETCTVTELCQRLFKDFPFGLQLVVKNTGDRGFVLDRHAITEPDRFLSDLVAGSYRETQA